MSLQDKFTAASKEVANFKTVEDDAIFATFYSLYKQATVGDCPESTCTGTDSRSVAKHKAWIALKGTSKEAAMQSYLSKYEELKPHYAK